RVLCVCALLLASVFVSVRVNPDLNWRALPPLQAVLVPARAAFLPLFWGGREKRPGVFLPGAAACRLVPGVMAPPVSRYHLRFSVREHDYPNPNRVDRARQAGPLIESVTPPAARVQYNPTWSPPWPVYLNRPFPLSDSGFASLIYGVSKGEHARVHKDIAD